MLARAECIPPPLNSLRCPALGNGLDLVLPLSHPIKAESPPWSGVTALAKECGRVEINRTNTAIEMAHKYAEEHKKEEVKPPEEFKRHINLFSDEEASKFPPSHE